MWSLNHARTHTCSTHARTHRQTNTHTPAAHTHAHRHTRTHVNIRLSHFNNGWISLKAPIKQQKRPLSNAKLIISRPPQSQVHTWSLTCFKLQPTFHYNDTLHALWCLIMTNQVLHSLEWILMWSSLDNHLYYQTSVTETVSSQRAPLLGDIVHSWYSAYDVVIENLKIWI